MESKFKREIAALDQVFEFVGRFLADNDIGEGASFSAKLAIEELFTNMVKYNPEGVNDISISMSVEDGKLLIRMVDFDVKPFDVSRDREVDVTKPIEERSPGGLGLHLVRNIMDKISSEYKHGNVYITLIKTLEN